MRCCVWVRSFIIFNILLGFIYFIGFHLFYEFFVFVCVWTLLYEFNFIWHLYTFLCNLICRVTRLSKGPIEYFFGFVCLWNSHSSKIFSRTKKCCAKDVIFSSQYFQLFYFLVYLKIFLWASIFLATTIISKNSIVFFRPLNHLNIALLNLS